MVGGVTIRITLHRRIDQQSDQADLLDLTQTGCSTIDFFLRNPKRRFCIARKTIRGTVVEGARGKTGGECAPPAKFT
jgi:hypothetical protein